MALLVGGVLLVSFVQASPVVHSELRGTWFVTGFFGAIYDRLRHHIHVRSSATRFQDAVMITANPSAFGDFLVASGGVAGHERVGVRQSP
jgi:hypothetical protein